MGLKCNSCFGNLEPGKSAVVTQCLHLFCKECATQTLQGDGACPCCENVVTNSTIKVIQLLTGAEDSKVMLALCGQPPSVVMEAALQATNFYLQQQDILSRYRDDATKKKAEAIKQSSRQKLSELQHGYVQLKEKYKDSIQKVSSMSADNQELQHKFAQKSMCGIAAPCFPPRQGWSFSPRLLASCSAAARGPAASVYKGPGQRNLTRVQKPFARQRPLHKQSRF